MQVIDSKWLKDRLTGEHGEQRRIADAVGISQDKLTKILAGIRTIRPHEAPRFVAYFDADTRKDGFSEAPAQFSGSDVAPVALGPGLNALMHALCADAAHPATYRLLRSEIGAGLLAGDIVLVDIGRQPKPGDLVLVTKNDPDTDTQETVLRRFAPPYLIDLSAPDRPLESSDPSLQSAIVATLVGSARPNLRAFSG